MILLKMGSIGGDVKKIQIKLGLFPDGIFGPNTQEAVKAWQLKNGLSPDGVVGKDTWSKMFPAIVVQTSDEIVNEWREKSGFTDNNTNPFTIIPENNNIVDNTLKTDLSGLNLIKLNGHIPDFVISQIPDTAAKFNITNTLRLAHFISQCSHESGNFTITTENLNYSAKRLKEVFPYYFPGNLSQSYAGNPEKIANRVYSSRMGNGDENSGDGWKHRGFGFIQTTGKYNQDRFSDFICDPEIKTNPQLIATKYPLSSAAFFFNSSNLWQVCDKGSDRATVEKVTKIVNGGLNGIEERLKYFNKYYTLLNQNKPNA